MTGFGKAVKVFNNKKITAEVKSLNSKQLDLSIRLPQAYREIELDLRNIIAKSLHRGKVDLFVYCEPIDGAVATSLNIDALKQYKVQLQAMSQQLDIPEPDDWYGTLLRLPDALKSDLNTSEVDDDEKNVVVEVVKNAIGGLNAFRLQEGKRLCGFFEEKIDAIQHLLDSVSPYEQSRVEKIKARILDSLQKLDGVEYDKNRFEQELIFYIEKLEQWRGPGQETGLHKPGNGTRNKHDGLKGQPGRAPKARGGHEGPIGTNQGTGTERIIE